MAVSPFLVRVPRKYSVDPEERKFWELLIQQMEDLRRGGTTAAAAPSQSSVATPSTTGTAIQVNNPPTAPAPTAPAPAAPTPMTTTTPTPEPVPVPASEPVAESVSEPASEPAPTAPAPTPTPDPVPQTATIDESAVFSDYLPDDNQEIILVEQLDSWTAQVQPVERRDVLADGITYDATNGDVVFVFNNAIVYLPDFPPSNAIVSILVLDNSLTKVRTRTKLINGEDEAQFSLLGSYYSFEYSPLTDEWRLT